MENEYKEKGSLHLLKCVPTLLLSPLGIHPFEPHDVQYARFHVSSIYFPWNDP